MPFSHETSIYFFQIVTDITCGFLKNRKLGYVQANTLHFIYRRLRH